LSPIAAKRALIADAEQAGPCSALMPAWRGSIGLCHAGPGLLDEIRPSAIEAGGDPGIMPNWLRSDQAVELKRTRNPVSDGGRRLHFERRLVTPSRAPSGDSLRDPGPVGMEIKDRSARQQYNFRLISDIEFQGDWEYAEMFSAAGFRCRENRVQLRSRIDQSFRVETTS